MRIPELFLHPLSGHVLYSSNGLYDHTAIFLGIDRNNQYWIAENHNPEGVRLRRLKDFQSEHPITQISRPSLPVEEVIDRALSQLGREYVLNKFNCQHYTNWAAYDKMISPDLQKYVGIGVAIIGISLLSILTSDKKKYDRGVRRYRDSHGRFV